MLLESLIRRLQAENGTPGTPSRKAGVPDTEPLKSAPRLNLEAGEHQEHHEHPKSNAGEFKVDWARVRRGIDELRERATYPNLNKD